jgi:hypothetical protein
MRVVCIMLTQILTIKESTHNKLFLYCTKLHVPGAQDSQYQASRFIHGFQTRLIQDDQNVSGAPDDSSTKTRKNILNSHNYLPW